MMALFNGQYKVAHPDWLPRATASLRKTIDLMENGSLPPCLTKPMLVVPMRWVLRSIYGNNLKAALTNAVRSAPLGILRGGESAGRRLWRHED